MVATTRPLTTRAARAILLAASIVSFAAVAARGDAQEITILRYEPLAGLTVTESSSNTDGTAPPTRMSFNAFGMRFAMTLTQNEALTRNLPPAVLQRLAAATFYIGTLDDNAESWVRITRTGDAWSGAIWDGTELYAIESFARVAAYVVARPEGGPTGLVIYRWSDTLSAATDILGPPAKSDSSSSQKVLAAAVFDELADSELKLSPAQQLDIGFLADSEFVRTYGASAEPTMVTIANIVDGIFLDQLGVRINVAELRTYAEPDAFSGTDATALLDQLEGIKYDTPELRGQGLVHLLTGRDLDERSGAPAGSRLLGVANFGVVCDERFAVGLTQFTDVNVAAVVVAHEMGHNFGAPHDAEPGSPCESMSDGFIMNPFFNGSRQFSQCSLQQMEAELAAATCLTSIPANDLSVQPLGAPGEVVANREFEIEFAVDYGGASEAALPALTIKVTNARISSISAIDGVRCSSPNNTPILDTESTCTFPRLAAAGGRITFSVRLFEPQAGPASVDLEVTSLNDYEPTNNRHRFEFNVLPEGHFELASSDVPAVVRPGESFDVDWVVVNAGQVPATQVRAEFRITTALDFLAVETASGTAACVQIPASFETWSCPIGTMAPGATVPLKLKVRVDSFTVSPGSMAFGPIWFKMTAAEPVFDWQNEWQETVTITSVIVDVHVVDLAAPALAAIGSDVTLTLRVGNRGPDAALNVWSSLSTQTGGLLVFNSATSTRGRCELSGSAQCYFGTLASGETVDVVAQATVNGQVQGTRMAGSAGTSDSFDTDRTNNERLLDFRVVAAPPLPPPPEPSPPPPAPTPAPPPVAAGGGGGGSVDLALLLLLVGAAVGRRSRARPFWGVR